MTVVNLATGFVLATLLQHYEYITNSYKQKLITLSEESEKYVITELKQSS
jgi:6,7-dimethyl-8-ribityllumazine synthase